MSNVIYKDFRQESEKKKLLEKAYIDACFKQIEYQILKSWDVDKKEFNRLKEKVKVVCQTMQVFSAI